MNQDRFTKGQTVYRYYTAEPAFIYGTGKCQEQGVVLGPPIEWNGFLWIPVKWQHSQAPDLSHEKQVHLIGEVAGERV